MGFAAMQGVLRRILRPSCRQTTASYRVESTLRGDESCHRPVMLDEVVQLLAPAPGRVFVDGTLGGGGHTRALAHLVAPTGHIIAVDRDERTVQRAKSQFADLPVTAVHASFEAIPDVLAQLQISRIDGILLDLGLSSDQLADTQRGFSFQADGPLDMRFDTASGDSAAALLARVTERDLADILFHFGEERYSRRIARQIVQQRREQPIKTARQLADIVRRCIPSRGYQRLDPATRSFQALRIAVNDELGTLERSLKVLPDCLQAGGRLVVISFHSLEDRAVKSAFRTDPQFAMITRKPLRPGNEEVFQNPRARSAKLRAAERVTDPKN